jgi:Rps23 Pro-64 3,4-dihydroxylase Tpa1-like proline 4-hydroxylase
MDIINKTPDINYIEDPYSIWVIDNFLKKDILDTIVEKWPSENDTRWHRGHEKINGKENILESGMRGISKIDLMPKEIGDLLKYFHSSEFTNKIGEMLGISGLIPDEYMRWSGMRTMIPNSYQLIHSDARISPESNLRKELTCLIYFNPDYNRKRDEGCLEIWSDDMAEKVHEIEPLLNRMTIFLNTEKSFHGVPLVKGERRAITFSIMKSGETSDRSKALFVARPMDAEEVRIEGINRSKIRDAKGY